MIGILKFCKFLIQNGILNDQELSEINDELKTITRTKIKSQLMMYQRGGAISQQQNAFSVQEFEDNQKNATGGESKQKKAIIKSVKSLYSEDAERLPLRPKDLSFHGSGKKQHSGQNLASIQDLNLNNNHASLTKNDIGSFGNLSAGQGAKDQPL